MRRMIGYFFLAVLVLICCTEVSFAGLALPPDVYRIASLKDVQAKARSMNVPIVFLYSNENSPCGLARKATLDVVDELGGRALIIYISKTDQGIPSDVITAMNSLAAGKLIPKTVAVNPKTGKVEMVIPYIADRDQRIAQTRKIEGLIPK